MARPGYVTDFERPERTAIKQVDGRWHLYECSYEYDPVRKRTRTKWGACLGRITEDGFRPKGGGAAGAVEAVQEIGATRWCREETEEMRGRLQEHFGNMWKQVYSVALLEAVSNDRLHRLAVRCRESVLSTLLPGVPMSSASLSRMVKKLGSMRGSTEACMKEDVDRLSRFLLVDGHRVLSAATDNPQAGIGHDSKKRWRPQVNLMHMFDTSGEDFGRPVWYRQFDGNRSDIPAVPEMLSELGMLPDHCIYVGDKGCAPARIIRKAEAAGVSCRVPPRRDNSFTKGRIPGNGGYGTAFTYHDRPVQATCFQQDGFNVSCIMTSTFARRRPPPSCGGASRPRDWKRKRRRWRRRSPDGARRPGGVPDLQEARGRRGLLQAACCDPWRRGVLRPQRAAHGRVAVPEPLVGADRLGRARHDRQARHAPVRLLGRLPPVSGDHPRHTPGGRLAGRAVDPEVLRVCSRLGIDPYDVGLLDGT